MSKDWAYLKVKLPERQASYIGYFLHKYPAGKGGHSIGVDFGGHTAHWSIINGLIRRGVAKMVGKELELTTGEPVLIEAESLPKPYIKVKKVLVDSWNGEDSITPAEKVVYLDPRGDGLFHIILPQEMASVFTKDPRRGLAEGNIFCATGETLKKTIANAESMAREYNALIGSSIEEVLVIRHECCVADKTKESVFSYDITTKLGFGFYKCLLIGGDTLWKTDAKGRLHRLNYIGGKLGTPEQKEHFFKQHSSIVMPYTPEREASLELLDTRLSLMAMEFKRVISEEDVATMLENNGHLLLEGPK